MSKPWYPFVSYNLWSSFEPPIGAEKFHCHTKRGFARARKKEPQVEALLSDTRSQSIGKIAQWGVYEFYQNPDLLSTPDGIERVARILQLEEQEAEVRTRVLHILDNYYYHPILADKQVIALARGDEGYPEPILIERGGDRFQLYAAFDCVLAEDDNTVHILDFKTGKSPFDRRQAYVYLLAARSLYPDARQWIASFYNLETGEQSSPISASIEAIAAVKFRLGAIAKQHDKQMKRYRCMSEDFARIFPPNPGFPCRYCNFSSICQFAEATQPEFNSSPNLSQVAVEE